MLTERGAYVVIDFKPVRHVNLKTFLMDLEHTHTHRFSLENTLTQQVNKENVQNTIRDFQCDSVKCGKTVLRYLPITERGRSLRQKDDSFS